MATTFCVALSFMLMVSNAYADPGTDAGKAMCAIAWAAQSSMGKGIATLGILMLGIGAMLGKVSWSMALLVAVGIVVVFNAGNIISTVDADANCWSEGTAYTPKPITKCTPARSKAGKC